MRATTRCCVMITVVVLVAGAACAQDAKPTIVLDTSGFWRHHYTYKPFVVKTADGVKPVLYKHGLWLNRDTAGPERGWESPDFDDAHWRRLPGTPFPVQRLSWLKLNDLNFGFTSIDGSSPFLAHLAMRGKFRVADPSKVKGLELSLAWRGGVVVSLNGTEVARGDMPAGPVTPDTLANDYPVEAFAKPDGSVLKGFDEIKPCRDRCEMHNRSLGNVRIPGTLLRKGVNVLAISVHRAPYDEIVTKQQKPGTAFVVTWSTCGLLSARLSAEDASGLVANVQRPSGVQVWNSNPMSPDFDLDWGDPNEPLRPIEIVGTRNGAFSGKVVIGSTEAIRGLAAKVTDLTSPLVPPLVPKGLGVPEGKVPRGPEGKTGGVIPAARVQVRWAVPDRSEGEASYRYPAIPAVFDALEETAPAEVPVREKRTGRGTWVLPGQPACIYGAVQPVWVTVNVPPDAKPGDYAGTLTLTAGGERFDVPVSLAVSAWRVPDPEHFQVFTELMQSPESVALHYKVPFWSDAHFKLMAKSLDLVREIGSRTTYLPLVAKTNMGNDESMVRWVEKPDGTWTHDFSVFERYLDLVIEHQGRPQVVCIYVWDHHTEKGSVPVSGVDADGTVKEIALPSYSDVRSKALWQPVIDGVHARLKARGLGGAMMFGLAGDEIPSEQTVSFFREISPETPWAIANHQSAGSRLSKYAKIGYTIDVWATNFCGDPEEGRVHGWALPRLKVHFERNIRDNFYLQTHRFLAEMNIAGESRGFARQGADFWPVLKDAKGHVVGALGLRYNSRRNLDVRATMLAPGAGGAVGTHRFEMIREGLQEAEARVFIEQTLVGKKITGDLAKRCQDVLDERTRAMLRGANSLELTRGTWREHPQHGHLWWSGTSEPGYQWFIASGWQQRSKELYAAAAEVSAKLGTK